MSEISYYSSESTFLDAQGLPRKIDLDSSEGHEGLQPFQNFINRLVDAENLIVLAGSGSSLTFNKPGCSSMAPSMMDLWESCKSLDEKRFNEILKIVSYHEVAGKWPNGDPKKDIELLLSLCDSYLPLKNLSARRQQWVSDFLKSSVASKIA